MSRLDSKSVDELQLKRIQDLNVAAKGAAATPPLFYN